MILAEATLSMDHKINPSAPQSSNLLRLPGEVRNIIYALVFADNTVMIPRNTRHTRGRSASNGLVLACKQIMNEAIEIYYMSTTFEFELGGKYRLSQWMDKIGPTRVALVQKIRLHTRFTDRGAYSDEYVRISTESAGRLLEAAQKETNLRSGVLEACIQFEDGLVWTSSPLVHGKALLVLTTWVYSQGRFWVTEPSESFKRNCPFIKPL